MSAFTLSKIRFQTGRWEGELTSTTKTDPNIEVTYLDRPVTGVKMIEQENPKRWHLSVPVPAEAISDGVHNLLINDSDTGETLGSFSILAGEALADDLRAEVELLRAELDLLKRAFRRHCLETQ